MMERRVEEEEVEFHPSRPAGIEPFLVLFEPRQLTDTHLNCASTTPRSLQSSPPMKRLKPIRNNSAKRGERACPTMP